MNGTILIYGNEEVLLTTRQLILEKAGYQVFSAKNVATALRALVNEPIDALLLCQSLSEDERRRTLETARAVKPDIKIVVFCVNGLEIKANNEQAFTSLLGPATLVKTISRLINT